MKHRKYFCVARLISPDGKSNLDIVPMLRTGLGYYGRGKHAAWVRVPPCKWSSGWKEKPGFAKLFYDLAIPEAAKIPFRGNIEASGLLQQPDTELIGHQAFDPKQAAIAGYAWLCRDGGRLCPSLKLGRGHAFAEVLNWLEQHMSSYFALCSTRDGLFLVQFESQESVDLNYPVWLENLDDEERDALHSTQLKPPNLTAMAVHAKLTWG
jgi:hypothetical protein